MFTPTSPSRRGGGIHRHRPSLARGMRSGPGGVAVGESERRLGVADADRRPDDEPGSHPDRAGGAADRLPRDPHPGRARRARQEVPLNDPAFGSSGVQEDGTLVCIWADPLPTTTHLTTKISAMSRGPRSGLLNGLADQHGFTCYTPNGGTRCESTWQDEKYPVTDGRTVFWRDDILIDTSFSNLAPRGYTAAIVESVFWLSLSKPEPAQA